MDIGHPEWSHAVSPLLLDYVIFELGPSSMTREVLNTCIQAVVSLMTADIFPCIISKPDY
jgi:hypothetical protein